MFVVSEKYLLHGGSWIEGIGLDVEIFLSMLERAKKFSDTHFCSSSIGAVA